MKGTWTPSQKRTKLLKDETGHLYRVYAPRQDVIAYRCTKKNSLKCPAVALVNKHTISDCEADIMSINHPHNHDPDAIGPQVRQIENEFIQAAALTGKQIFILP